MSQHAYYDLVRQRVAGAVSEAAIASKMMDHPGLAGQIREIALRNCLLPFLTHSFRCGTGKILDTTGYITKQIDLIVYHTKLASPLLINNDLGIFPTECCAYALEVKSTLNSSEIKNLCQFWCRSIDLKLSHDMAPTDLWSTATIDP